MLEALIFRHHQNQQLYQVTEVLQAQFQKLYYAVKIIEHITHWHYQ